MWGGFELIATNVGFSFENIILMIVFTGGLIFAAKDFRLASIYWLVSSGGAFLWFYQLSQSDPTINWSFALALFFISLVLMAFNLFNIRRNPEVV